MRKYFMFVLIYTLIICQLHQLKCSVLNSTDILFVVDDYVLPADSKRHLNSMLISMVEKAMEGDSNSRSGFIFYSETADTLWNFNDPAAKSRDDASELITKKLTTSESKKSCLAGGIGQAFEIFNNMERTTRPKILILVSHQAENCGNLDLMLRMAKNLTDNNVFIVSVTIGEDANNEIMEKLASSPKLYYHMVDYTQADNMIHVVVEKLSTLVGTYIPIPPIENLDKTFNNEKFCESSKSDLKILVDSSNYVPDDLFELLKQAAHHLLINFCSNGKSRRTSLTFFNAISHHLWGFDSINAQNYLNNKEILLNSQRPNSGGGDICISNALNDTVNEMFESKEGDNDSSKKVVVMFTTGENTCTQQNQAWFQAARLKNLGGTVIVIGVGPAAICDSLRSIASGGVNYFHINDVVTMGNDMQKVVQQIFTYSENGMKMMNEQKEKFKRDLVIEKGPRSFLIKSQIEMRYVILLNIASAITKEYFLLTKSVALQLVEKLKTKKVKYKIVVGTFSDRLNLLWNFDNKKMVTNENAIKNQINNLTKSSDYQTCLASSMESVLTDAAFLVGKTSKYTGKFLFVVTALNQDCESESYEDIWKVAVKNRKHKVTVLTIGIGTGFYGGGLKPYEFRRITSDGYDYVELTDEYHDNGNPDKIVNMEINYQPENPIEKEIVEPIIKIKTEKRELVSEKVIKEVELTRENEQETQSVPKNGFDIAILVENTCYVDEPSFALMKRETLLFMQKLYKDFPGTRFSFATFSETFSPQYYFDSKASVNIEEATAELKTLRQDPICSRCLSAVLRDVNQLIFHPKYVRPNITMVLITIGVSTEQCMGVVGLTYYAQQIKRRGIQMFSMGLGGNTDRLEMNHLGTTEKMGEYIFTQPEYSMIASIYEIIFRRIKGKQFETYDLNRGDESNPRGTDFDPRGNQTLEQIDIVVIMDISKQTTNADFENMKATLLTMYKNLVLGTRAIKIALITVSSEATIHWVYTFTLKSIDLFSVTHHLPHLTLDKSPQACIYKGIIAAMNRIFHPLESKPEAFKLIIVFGSGNINCDYEYLINVANHAKNTAITIATVGFGLNINETNLIQIASSAGNYFESDNIMPLVNILNTWARGRVQTGEDTEKYVENTKFLVNQRNDHVDVVVEYAKKEADILSKTVIDLVIVVNAKGPEDKIKDSFTCFIRSIYEFFQPKDLGIYIALVIYGKETNVVLTLRDGHPVNLDEAIETVDTYAILPVPDNVVCVEKAFEELDFTMLSDTDARKISKKVILHITDYKSNCGDENEINDSMKAMKKKRMLFFSVGISDRVDKNLIKTIASDKTTQLFLTSFRELCEKAEKIGKMIEDFSVTDVKISYDSVSNTEVVYKNNFQLKKGDRIRGTKSVITNTPIVDESTITKPLNEFTRSTLPGMKLSKQYSTPESFSTPEPSRINSFGSTNQTHPIFNPFSKAGIHVNGSKISGGRSSSSSNQSLPTFIKRKFCPAAGYQKLGCVDDVHGVNFPFQIVTDACQNNCSMGMPVMNSLACNCALETQRRGLKSFGITNGGGCYGSTLTNSNMPFVATHYCEGNDRKPCSKKRTLCFGGRSSLFAFGLDSDYSP